MEIGTSPRNPIIPEIRDSIITVNDVKVLILRPGDKVSPQQSQPPQQQSSILNLQSIIENSNIITVFILT